MISGTRSRVALVALLALTGCPSEKKKPSTLPPADEQFWTWFAFDEVRLAHMARAPQRLAVVVEITQRVRAVSQGIVAEVSVPPEKDAPVTLVFSVNGDTTLFPLVRSFVAGAPPLKLWKVVAFRQRRAVPPTLQFADLTVHPEDFLFRETGRTAGKLDIEIHVRGLTPDKQSQIDQAAFLLLDHVIGEYDTETKLHAIDIKPMAVAADASLKPLTALAPLVDALPAVSPDGG